MSIALDDLKYKQYIASCKCGACPPAHCSSVQTPVAVIRYGYGSRPNAQDFIPVYIQSPKRALSATQFNVCSGYGLSFYDTPDNARARLQPPAKSAKKIKHRWKTLLRTTIQSTDGLATPIAPTGHFDLHESKNARLELQSVFLEDL